MATQDQVLDIPLIGGLTEQADSSNVKPPGFLRLENGLLDKAGAVHKRKGADITYTANLATDHEPRWLGSLGKEIVMGTTEGVYGFPKGVATCNNPYGTMSTSVEHQVLSGLGQGIVQIDSFSENDYTVVCYTTNSNIGTSATDYIVGTDVWYAVFDTETGQLIKAPVRLSSAGSAIRPLVVFNGASVSFWWIDGTQVNYTTGKTIASLIGTPGLFTVNPTGSAATDIAFDRYDPAGTEVIVFISAVSAVEVRLSSAALTTWTNGASVALTTDLRYIRSLYFAAPGECTVVVVEGTAALDYGVLEACKYSPTTNSWTASGIVDYLRASPQDIPSGVLAADYSSTATRFALGKAVDSLGDEQLTFFGSCHYHITEVAGNVYTGTGCVTTYLTIPVVAYAAFVYRNQIPTYTVATDAFPVTGRTAWSVGLKRSGIARTINAFSPRRYVFTWAENFAAVIFVAPLDAYDLANVSPVSTAFDLRTPVDISNVVTTLGVPTAVVQAYSLGKVYDHGDQKGTLSVFYRTLLSGRPASQTLSIPINGTVPYAIQSTGDYQFEVARVITRPSPIVTSEVNGLLAASGIPSYYDGAFAKEIVPHDIPILSASMDNSEVAADNARVIYSWVDGAGNIHRSAPSEYSTLLYNGVSSISIAVWAFPLTAFVPTTAADVLALTLEIYQEDNGIYGLVARVPFDRGVTPAGAPHIRVFSAYTQTPQANLYTTGDILENQAPPVFRSTCVAKNRMLGLTTDKLFYSKPIEDRVAPEFNYNLTVDIPDVGGKTVAILGMDDKVVVLCERATFVLYGDGPNAAGAGGAFSELLPIPGNIGCVCPGSVVETPKGVAFLSEQGFYLLDRGLNLQFIGNPVVDKTSLVVTQSPNYFPFVAAIHDVADRHIRWICNPDIEIPLHLIWYYDTNQWGEFTAFGEMDAIYLNGNVVSLFGAESATAAITTENVNRGMYASQDFPDIAFYLKVRTGWINTAGIEGFQRAKRFAFITKASYDPNLPATKAAMDIKLYSDYQVTADSTHSWDEAAMTAMPNYAVLEMQVQPKVQKLAAISAEFIEGSYAGVQDPESGVGATISGITMRIGARKGPQKHIAVTRKR